MADVKIVDTAEYKTPEIDVLVNELVEQVQFSSGKAMAHLAEPRAYPLPDDSTALERILVNAARVTNNVGRIDRLKSEGLKFAADPLNKISRERIQLFRNIDLRSGESIHEQIKTGLGLPVSSSEYPSVFSGELPAPVDEPTSTLEWHLNRVACIEETGITSYGKDELYIGGTTIDAFGNAISGGVQYLGKWNSDDSRSLDSTLAINNLSRGVGWPRTYYYVLAISVRGDDKLYAFLDKLVQYARDYAVNYTATAVGAAAGTWAGLKMGAYVGSLGGPLGAAAGAAIGALVGYLVGSMINALWDEISGFFSGETKLFPSRTVEVNLPRQGDMFGDGSSHESVYIPPLEGFGGEYHLGFDVRLSWIPSFQPAAISRLKNHIELVSTDNDSGLRLKTWAEYTDWAWTDWQPMREAFLTADTPISLVACEPWRLDAFTTDCFGKVRGAYREWNIGVQPTQWRAKDLPELAGLINGTAISAVSRGLGHIDVFITCKDGYVYSAAKGPQTNDEWAGWRQIGDLKLLPGTPISSVSRSEGHLDLFAIGEDGRIWSTAYGARADGEWNWINWFPVLNELFLPGSRVTAHSRQLDQIDLFAVTLTGEVRTAAWSSESANGEWGGWWRITETDGMFAPGTPISVVNRNENSLDVFAVGLDGRIWTAAWGPQTENDWAGWWPIGEAVFAQGSVITATSRGLNNIDLFIRGFDGNIWSHAWDGEWKTFVI